MDIKIKNIAIIVYSLQGGGAERCAADLSVILSNKGYNIYIITDIGYEVKYEYCGHLVNYVFSIPTVGGENPLIVKVNELIDIKRKYGIDISISFMQIANYLNILAKDNDKVILTTHNLTSEYAKMDKSIFWADKTFNELYQFADMITFPSKYCRSDWVEHYADENHITKTVYNPVHLMNVNNNTNKENIVITVGRMHAIKRQWHLIRAFKRVKELCPDSRLIILGDGELREKLKILVKKLGLEDCVEMPGNVGNVDEYLEKAKVFALTSRYESLCCAALESLSAGVPVVTADFPGGIREVMGVGEKRGEIKYPILCENGVITPDFKECYMECEITVEEECFAEEISRILKDDVLRLKMGKTSRNNIQKFTAQEIGRVWVEEIIENKSRRIVNEEDFDKIRNQNFKDFLTINRNENMYVSYYRLLEKWMALKEKNVKISTYFERNKMSKIIVYGLGKMSNHIMADLNNSGIEIMCAIDRQAVNKFEKFPIIPLDGEIPKADCIVVTPVYQFENIKNELCRKTSNLIVSLDEVIGNLYEEKNNDDDRTD